MTEPRFDRIFTVEDSTSIFAYAYDPMTQTLDVAFHSGGIYRYTGVSHFEFACMATASSAGKAFIAIIRDKKKFEKTARTSLV